MFEFTQAVARNLFHRGRSRVQLGKDRNVRWMRPQEENIVRDVLEGLQPMSCLEWGSGMSTLTFPPLLSPEARWLSVEHDREWAEIVRRANPLINVATALVPPDQPDWGGETSAAAFASYIRYPAQHGPYDFVLIDGRARTAAIHAVPGMLADGGVVILHDANRSDFVSACGVFPHQMLFQDARSRSRRPSGGIWVGSMNRPLHTVFDVALHQRIWDFYSGIGKPLA